MAGFTLRAAREADMPEIARIATHYILNTVITFHEEVQPVDVYAKAFHSCQALGLPYLVAVKPSKEDADRGKDAGNDAGTKEAPNETVIGYAYANGYRAERMGYRFASELSIFCDPGYTGCGVGSRLLGELLAILKTPSSFLTAPYNGSYPAGIEPRKVRQLISVMSIDVTGKREGKALQGFYESFGFVFRGRLVEIGYKFGRWIDTVELQYTFY
ncbi:gnat family n-acetyltransferase [Ophiostoma piceae UAMH 11346]|uniref:Gnat family n-acetyltransferase n=1 Tax=Ophiostoma piceae (strain UAMH 11346) TaxID=1262450 RepID=S3C5W9_OPHP1|nr:gnat family n-acetyltransferase [Ophiostoma piceae UAMH 11346]